MSLRPLPRLTLVLGGARSGKSRHAEALVMGTPPPWIYVATAEALDEEMQARVDAHKRSRSARWQTIEAPLELAATVTGLAAQPQAILIDCLTLWLSNIMLAERDAGAECDRLIAALKEASGPLVAVSNEVGLGVVPESPLGRAFRDAQGLLNQRVAGIAEHVVFLAAGLPLTLK
jgi:adenosylcobinamide kinase/adenosylcobinamide-phosphate guanylyltransferase